MERKAPENFLRDHEQMINFDSILVSDGYSAPALGWFNQRSDILLLESAGELKYGLTYPDARNRRLSFPQFRKMVKSASGGRKFLLFLDTDRYLKDQLFLPRPLSVTTGDGFVLAEF